MDLKCITLSSHYLSSEAFVIELKESSGHLLFILDISKGMQTMMAAMEEDAIGETGWHGDFL
ncbi:hypothetical protein BG005_004272, partial [Podila minutissima]